jgi:hypothetical protein
LVFGSFTQSSRLSTLQDEVLSDSEVEIASESSDSENNSEEIKRKAGSVHHMADDQVFKACNGVILRKFVPEGKLARLAAQDKAFMSTVTAPVPEKTFSDESEVISEPLPKKSKVSKKRAPDFDREEPEPKKSRTKDEKKSKKKSKSKENSKKSKTDDSAPEKKSKHKSKKSKSKKSKDKSKLKDGKKSK